jgi:plasmid maintenance system antidote protein VapI
VRDLVEIGRMFDDAAQAFGGGADTWFRLQAAFDLAQAMKKADEIKVQRITRAA